MKNDVIDSYYTTPSDYCCLVGNIPKGKTDTEIREQLKKRVGGKEFSIEFIERSFYI